MGKACAALLADSVDVLLLAAADGDSTAAAAGTLRAVAHAAGISPTMASWDRVLTVDLYGTALLIETLRPRVRRGTAFVCFVSMAPLLRSHDGDPADAVLDAPLDPAMASRLRAALGSSAEDPGIAYSWAKRGVQRLVAREASWFGARGARICSVSPGIIATPQGQRKVAAHPSMATLVKRTPLGPLTPRGPAPVF